MHDSDADLQHYSKFQADVRASGVQLVQKCAICNMTVVCTSHNGERERNESVEFMSRDSPR